MWECLKASVQLRFSSLNPCIADVYVSGSSLLFSAIVLCNFCAEATVCKAGSLVSNPAGGLD